jgi:hypothetical protein
MTNKELSNDQRSRLEQIAHDEFSIRQREIQTEKQKALHEWQKAEVAKAKNSEAMKKYIKLRNESLAIVKKFNKAGFSISMNNNGNVDMHMITSSYSGETTAHPQFKARAEASNMNQDQFTRALNKVLSIIWSMEKPFSECIELINSEVKKLNK